MQTRDFRDLLETTVAEPGSLPPCDPPPLLLIQPAEQHVELSMIFSLPRLAGPTRSATTLVNDYFC